MTDLDYLNESIRLYQTTTGKEPKLIKLNAFTLYKVCLQVMSEGVLTSPFDRYCGIKLEEDKSVEDNTFLIQ